MHTLAMWNISPLVEMEEFTFAPIGLNLNDDVVVEDHPGGR